MKIAAWIFLCVVGGACIGIAFPEIRGWELWKLTALFLGLNTITLANKLAYELWRASK